MHNVNVLDRPSIRVAALPHTGAYTEIGAAFQQVAAVFSTRGLWPHARGMVGIYYDDVSVVPEADLKSHAGIRIDADFDLPEGLEEVLLPAGPCAIVKVLGPYSGLKPAYDYLYGEWLPTSGRVPADVPPYEIYLNDPTDTPQAQLETCVCVPLAA